MKFLNMITMIYFYIVIIMTIVTAGRIIGCITEIIEYSKKFKKDGNVYYHNQILDSKKDLIGCLMLLPCLILVDILVFNAFDHSTMILRSDISILYLSVIYLSSVLLRLPFYYEDIKKELSECFHKNNHL